MRKLTQIEFIKKCILKYGNKYDYSKVKYINSKVKVCIICHEKDEFGEEHGEFWQRPNDHLNGCGCPKCNDKYIPTTEEWIKKAKQVHGDKYDYSKTVYINSQTNICIICPEHGEFWQLPSTHLKGSGCPLCVGTHGEQYIMEFLNKNNIQFEFQKTFKWLKYRKNLYLDFYLPELKCCIEFQGEQHYKPINFGSKNKKELLSEFKLIQKRDIVKEKLCRENNIRIFYIKYDELFNIENIINNIIKECNQ